MTATFGFVDSLRVGSCLPTEVFIGKTELGSADGRRRTAETKIDIDPVQSTLIGHPSTADVDDVLAFFQVCPVRYRNG